MIAIKDLKDLGKLIDLCRKKGVETVKVDGVEFTLGDVPQAPRLHTAARDMNLPPESYIPIIQNTMAIASEDLTEEQLLFYSTGAEEE